MKHFGSYLDHNIFAEFQGKLLKILWTNITPTEGKENEMKNKKHFAFLYKAYLNS